MRKINTARSNSKRLKLETINDFKINGNKPIKNKSYNKGN
jgi:hypothetical protein